MAVRVREQVQDHEAALAAVDDQVRLVVALGRLGAEDALLLGVLGGVLHVRETPRRPDPLTGHTAGSYGMAANRTESPRLGQPRGHGDVELALDLRSAGRVHDPPGGVGVGVGGRGVHVDAPDELGLVGGEHRVQEALARVGLLDVVGQVVTVDLERHRLRRPAPRLAVDREQALAAAHHGGQVDLRVVGANRAQVMTAREVEPLREVEVGGDPVHDADLRASRGAGRRRA